MSMRYFISFLGFLLMTFQLNSQELNCKVTINSEQIQGSNKQVFKTLETALNEYLNQTQWTNQEVKTEERIDCSINIIITSRDNNQFTASLQIQSSRPVFGSTFTTTLLNLRDENLQFRYNEFDPLIYNKTSYDSNLVSTLVYYVYIILGTDADTFTKFSGEPLLKEAQNAMLQAQQSGLSAWQNNVGKQNRFSLIDDLLSNDLKEYRANLYEYHRNGMDVLSADLEQGKQQIESSLLAMNDIYNKSVGNYLLRVFFDAKSDEIKNIFSGGPKVKNPQRLSQILGRLSPNNKAKWSSIK